MLEFWQSWDYHYPIHMITAKEKDDAVSNLWEQYTEEMQIMEGNTHTINGAQLSFSQVQIRHGSFGPTTS